MKIRFFQVVWVGCALFAALWSPFLLMQLFALAMGKQNSHDAESLDQILMLMLMTVPGFIACYIGTGTIKFPRQP